MIQQNQPQQHWMDFFQAVFGANTTQWLTTLDAWNDLFIAEGRSNGELVSVVRAISKRNPLPKFPTDFLEAIRQELRAQDDSLRENQETRRLADLTKPTRCRLCKDTGWVSGLPHLNSVYGADWRKPRYEMATTCQCGLGAHIHGRWANAQPEPKFVMTFAEYQAKNPFWQAQLELRQKERAAELAAHTHQHGEPSWKATVERILERMKNGGTHEQS